MRKLSLLAVAICLFLAQLTAPGQTPKKGKAAPKKTKTPSKADASLTLEQIRKLVVNRIPDNVVSQEIQSRGIADDYNRKDVEQFQQRGAGPQTLAALTMLLPLAVLTVQTEPGAAVGIDDTSAGTAGQDGRLSIGNLEPGTHTVTAGKQFFAPFSRTVELKGRENASVEAKLEWAFGFLTVKSNIADSQIRVQGQSAQRGPITRLPVPIGQTTVVATAPLRKSVSQTVVIGPGKETSLAFSLQLDEAAAASLLNKIHASFQTRHYELVLGQSEQFLRTGLHDKTLLAEIALSNLETGHGDLFLTGARDALEAGASLNFQLQHYHAGLRIFVHPATIQVSAKSLAFHPIGTCNFQPFEVSVNAVRVGPRGSVVTGPNERVPSLEIRVPNPSNAKKDVNINLTAGDNQDRVNTIREFLRTVAH